MRHHFIVRASGATILTLALGLGTAACGNNNDTSSAATQPSATEHNAADVAFATEMLQHHAQALSMVDLTVDRPLTPEVAALAEQIRDAQAPEIETFTDWLTDWDEEVPATVRDHANAGHDMGEMGDSMEGVDTDMPGMMTAEEMTALEEAPDSDFQTMWLEMMVKHHTGAVEMAKEEAEKGRYQSARDLAEDIATSQAEEIDTMQQLLGS